MQDHCVQLACTLTANLITMAKSAALALLLTISSALLFSAAAEKKVLVLYGASNIKDTHSQFIQGLEDQGLKVDLKSVKDSGLKLKDYDTWLYDALVLLAPKATSRCMLQP